MSRKIVLSLFLVCVMLVTTGIAYPVQARPAYSWEQVNAPDIVVPGQMFTALEEFQGQLYAGTENFFYTSSVPEPVGVWRSTNGRKWTKVLDAGTSNWLHFGKFRGQLYVGGTSTGDPNSALPAHIWRSRDGANWEDVVTDGFGDPNNVSIASFSEFRGMFYASTFNFDTGAGLTPIGTQIWGSPSGDPGTWRKVFTPNNPDRFEVTGFYQFRGKLYAALEAGTTSFQLWCTGDGLKWNKVGQDGFGNPNALSTSNPLEWQGNLYLGFGSLDPARSMIGQLWRSTDGIKWVQVMGAWSKDPNNTKVESLVIYQGDLYAVTDNLVTGAIVWRTQDGKHWEQASQPGFGDPANTSTQWGSGVKVFRGDLYVGTGKMNAVYPEDITGEIWRLNH